MSEETPGVIRPPAIFYEQEVTNPSVQTIAAQQNYVYLCERIDATPNGILRYYQGMKYPEKGWPTPETVWKVNIVKRVLMGSLLGLIHQYNILPLLGFLLTPWRWKIKAINKFLIRFNHTCNWVLSTAYYKEEIYCPAAKELKRATYLFLYYLGIDPAESKLFAKIFSTLLETDDAYRYRMQDIFSETTKERLLADPRGEINRLLMIYLEREGFIAQDTMRNFGPGYNFRIFGKLLSWMLLIPKIRRAFIKTTQEIDITALQLDEADRYHVLWKTNYNYLGRTAEDRKEEWIRIHDNNPPPLYEYKIT